MESSELGGVFNDEQKPYVVVHEEALGANSLTVIVKSELA